MLKYNLLPRSLAQDLYKHSQTKKQKKNTHTHIHARTIHRNVTTRVKFWKGHASIRCGIELIIQAGQNAFRVERKNTFSRLSGYRSEVSTWKNEREMAFLCHSFYFDALDVFESAAGTCCVTVRKRNANVTCIDDLSRFSGWLREDLLWSILATTFLLFLLLLIVQFFNFLM